MIPTKTVYVRRLPISNTEKNASDETQEYFNQGNRHIGSYFNKDSIRPGTGLTVPEEKLLMPTLLEMSTEDREYNKSVSNYFHEIYIKIPPHDKKKSVGGLALNISLEDNTKPFSKDNLPLNFSDYVKYRFIISHPEVALSEAIGTGDQLKAYFIYDEASVKKEQIAEGNIKDEAITIYIKIKDDMEKVLQFLIALDIPRDEYLNKETELLRQQAEVAPEKFVKVSKNGNLAVIALLKEMIEAKIIEKAGERLLYTESKNIFAVDTKDAIGFLKDPANSNDVLAFKGKIQAFRKAVNK